MIPGKINYFFSWKQYCRSMTFYFGSGSGSMHLTNESDPDPDPTIFVIDLQEAYKKQIFSAYYFLKVRLHRFFKDKMKCR